MRREKDEIEISGTLRKPYRLLPRMNADQLEDFRFQI
jgi:hypothetical protein